MIGTMQKTKVEPKNYCIWFNKKPCWDEFSVIIKDPNGSNTDKLLACVVCQVKDLNTQIYKQSKRII